MAQAESSTKRRFEVEAKLGSGTYGSVYRCFDNKTQQTVALKKLKISALEDYGIPGIILRELAILKSVNHPNTVRLLDMVCQKDILLVFEFVDASLYSYIRAKEEPLPISSIKVG